MLQDAIASVDDYEFEIETALAKQLGAKPLPFPGMDSKLKRRVENNIIMSSTFLAREQSSSVRVLLGWKVCQGV